VQKGRPGEGESDERRAGDESEGLTSVKKGGCRLLMLIDCGTHLTLLIVSLIDNGHRLSLGHLCSQRCVSIFPLSYPSFGDINIL